MTFYFGNIKKSILENFIQKWWGYTSQEDISSASTFQTVSLIAEPAKQGWCAQKISIEYVPELAITAGAISSKHFTKTSADGTTAIWESSRLSVSLYSKIVIVLVKKIVRSKQTDYSAISSHRVVVTVIKMLQDNKYSQPFKEIYQGKKIWFFYSKMITQKSKKNYLNFIAETLSLTTGNQFLYWSNSSPANFIDDEIIFLVAS